MSSLLDYANQWLPRMNLPHNLSILASSYSEIHVSLGQTWVFVLS